MKKIIILFCIILAICSVFAVQASVCFAEDGLPPTDGETIEPTDETPSEADAIVSAWEVYLKEKLLPILMAVLTAVSTIYIAIAPIIAKVKSTMAVVKAESESFTTATKGVHEAIGKVDENGAKVNDFQATLASFSAKLDAIEKRTEESEEIMRIAFMNSEELVSKGYAGEIAKVGKKDETSQS